MIFEVCNLVLDKNKFWYTVNNDIYGIKPGRVEQNQFFKLFPNELKINFTVQCADGGKTNPVWFDAKYQLRDVNLEISARLN